MTDVGQTRGTMVAFVVLVLVLGLLLTDLVTDASRGAGLIHMALEACAALLAAGAILWLLTGSLALRRRQQRLEHRLEASRREAERWHREAKDLISGLRRAIDRQFERWELTPAERHVAMLLLQGLGHKQIAARRGSSERTVRQQAHVLYRKAGLSGRADLAAFFLGDLVGHEFASPGSAKADTDGSTSEKDPRPSNRPGS